MNRNKIVELNAKTGDLEKHHLTEVATYEKLPADVKKQLPSLLERLNQATTETGKMSALAAYLKAPLASVSRWLSGKREPGGEITLRMLRWVEHEEHQK
jgi:DNA-binding transcriptional regulator YiaG